MAGTQPSQSDDSNVHFRDMPVLTNGKSCYLNAVIEPFSLRQGIKGKSASVVEALFLPCPGHFHTTVSPLPHLTV